MSCRKRNKTPSRLFVRSGPESSTLFRDVPLVSAAESKTKRILSGFWGGTLQSEEDTSVE